MNRIFSIDELAGRVARGEPGSRSAFQATLGPSLLRIVRRTLERGQGASALEKSILAVARDMRQQQAGRPPIGREPWARRVTATLCQEVVERLTVTASATKWHQDTVCC